MDGEWALRAETADFISGALRGPWKLSCARFRDFRALGATCVILYHVELQYIVLCKVVICYMMVNSQEFGSNEKVDGSNAALRFREREET